jgi:hypothetical protein
MSVRRKFMRGNRQKRFSRIILPAVLILALPVRVLAATEGDLCTVCGMAPDGASAASTARAIVSSCTRQQNKNELLSMLDDYGLSDYGDDIFASAEGMEAYESIINGIRSGKKARDALADLSAYETYYLFMSSLAGSGYDLSYESALSDEEIAERLAYAAILRKSAGSSADIGKVGASAPLFTGENILYPEYLSSSYATFSVTQDADILALLSGTVTKASGDSVSVSCGGTIVYTVSGLDVSVKNGADVSQGNSLGTAKDTLVTVTLSVRGTDICPISMYGTRALSWADSWNTTNAGIYDAVALGNLLDAPEDGNAEEEMEILSAGYAEDDDGNRQEVTVSDDAVPAGDHKEVDTDSLPDGWLVEEEDTSYLEQSEGSDEVITIPLK